MASKKFSEIEIDAIGEIMNISLGASATAISTMLDARVDITTPIVRIVSKSEFSFSNLQPAIGVEITYVTGLDGKNIMLLKRRDVKVIIELLMGMEVPDEEFELDEMNTSAICEVMNQMMGASSTALSEFLGKVVNISTPTSFEIGSEDEFIDMYFEHEDEKVVIDFILTIDDKMKSEFVSVMSLELAKELVEGFLPEDMIMRDEEPIPIPTPVPVPVPVMAPVEQPVAAVQPQPMAAPAQQPVAPMPVQPDYSASVPMAAPMQGMPAQAMPMQPGISNEAFMAQQQMMQQMMQQMQQMQAQLLAPPPRQIENKTINAPQITHPEINGRPTLGEEQEENLELVMGVPLEVSVEIGRTQSLVKDILEYTKGTLVILDKQAGDQVDLFVNGQCIARGDVVVVDDNFGIRITEVLKRPEL